MGARNEAKAAIPERGSGLLRPWPTQGESCDARQPGRGHMLMQGPYAHSMVAAALAAGGADGGDGEGKG